MKSLKWRLIAVGAAILLAVAAVLLVNRSSDKKEHDLQQNFIDSDTIQTQAGQRVAAPDIALPQPKQPVLKINGKESPDVYLQSLDIQVATTGNVAATRYTMVFKNKTNSILEGELTFPLPDERSVTFYALDINGRMREAVPVEKAKATQVFEEIEQRRVDPGLLERVEGNNFRTRIYPIPSNGTRTISIGYEEELTLENNMLQYRLPMAYPDPIEKFSVKATVWKSAIKPIVSDSADELRFDKVGENYVASFARENYHPARALNFSLPAPADIPQIMMQSAQGSYYFFASIAPKLETRKKQWNDNLAIIWDISLSASQRNFKREYDLLNTIFTEKKNAKVHIYFLNNRLKKAVNKNATGGEYAVNNGNWDEVWYVLNTAVFDGGTDFSQIKLNEIAGNEVLFFSDGISTLSDADFIKNTAANRPVHCIVSSAKADYSAMKLIAGKTKGKFVNINALSAEKLKDELQNETLQFLGTEHGRTVREVYPSIATPVHGNFSLAGISDANEAELTLLFGFGNTVEKRITVSLDAKKADRQGNVHKLWAQKKIAELDLNYQNNRDELTELGQQFGIVTRNTSLIVLETLDDYIRYNIDPPAELRDEYLRRQKRRDERRRDTERAMLNNAVAAAENITNWWFTDFTPKMPKYPTPDEIIDTLNDDANIEELVSGGSGGSTGSTVAEDGGGASDTHRSVVKSILKSINGAYDFVADGLFNLNLSNLAEDVWDFLNTPIGGYSRDRSVDFFEKLPEERSAKYVTSEEVTATLERYRENRERGSQTARAVTDFDDDREVLGSRTMPNIVRPEERGMQTNLPRTDPPDGDNYQERGSRVAPANSGVSSNKGGGDPRARVTQMGVLGIVSGEIKGKNAAAADILARSGFAEDLDAVLSGSGGVGIDELSGGSSASERKLSSREKTSSPRSADNKAQQEGKVSQPTIQTKQVRSDNDYLNNLTGNAANDYQTYLKIRSGYAHLPAFYFDMADWFYRHGDRELALRALTSIADLDLENASLYRLLGYKLKEYGEYALEKFVCQKVVQWRPMEPQSHRDYALALSDNGEKQAALDSLYGLLTRLYSENISNRSHGIEEVVVTEISHLITQNANLKKSNIDKRLILNIPVDIRVVINWNMNSTDIDLHVKDPNNEECSYNRTRTNMGGRISPDVTNGYGPEQFLLKHAVRGRYRVYVNYYGDRQVTSAGPSTVMAEIFTKYADKTEQRQVVCLQLSNAKKRDGKVEVAYFDF